MASFFASGNDAERVADYRKRSDEMFAQAAIVSDTATRAAFIDVGNSYLKLAQSIESQALRRAMEAVSVLDGPDEPSERPDPQQ